MDHMDFKNPNIFYPEKENKEHENLKLLYKQNKTLSMQYQTANLFRST